MNQDIDALDLYAKVEDMLGLKEASSKLYSYYFEILKEIEFDSVLDIGCGSGEFLSIIDSLNICKKSLGIDRSALMVKRAQANGINAKNIELSDIKDKFSLATATFDMVNYLNKEQFFDFFKDLAKVVKRDGYFLFDINTLFGLSELAVGNFIEQDENRFVTIESFYEDEIYDSFFTLFEKNENGLYKKSSSKISQYYHSLEDFEKLDRWKLESVLPISLYEYESVDKNILLLKNCK